MMTEADGDGALSNAVAAAGTIVGTAAVGGSGEAVGATGEGMRGAEEMALATGDAEMALISGDVTI